MDRFDIFEAGDDFVNVLQAFDFDIDKHFVEVGVAVVEFDIHDIAAGLEDGGCDVVETAGAIEDDGKNAGDKKMVLLAFPLHIDPALRHVCEFVQLSAICGVDGDAFSGCDDGANVLARDGEAALGERDHHVVDEASDFHLGLRFFALEESLDDRGMALLLEGFEVGIHGVNDFMGRDHGRADGGEQVFGCGVLGL